MSTPTGKQRIRSAGTPGRDQPIGDLVGNRVHDRGAVAHESHHAPVERPAGEVAGLPEHVTAVSRDDERPWPCERCDHAVRRQVRRKDDIR